MRDCGTNNVSSIDRWLYYNYAGFVQNDVYMDDLYVADFDAEQSSVPQDRWSVRLAHARAGSPRRVQAAACRVGKRR